ncbi:hypothetical protein ABT298_22430 [Streptomyces sp. NPDC001034]|uniref:hypothetical protein n=1 Tax=Streptomyces sp. NPDC001034 TaxID=3154375 RepID=UPI0033255FDD
MSGANSANHQDSASAKARQVTAKVTAPASQAADRAAGKSGAVGSAAVGAARRTAGAGTAAVRGAAERVQAGRQVVIGASGRAVAAARTAWTVIARRKVLAAGAGAGLSALGAASYLAGRRAARRTHGPITRLTGGRI